MASVRLNKICRQFNVGLASLVAFLNEAGCPVEVNPNAKIDSEWLPQIRDWASGCEMHSESVADTLGNGTSISGNDLDIVLTVEPADNVQETPVENREQPLKQVNPGPVDSSEWESIVRHAIKAIPSPRTKEVNQFIIEKIDSWLREDEIELVKEPVKQEHEQDDELTAQKVIERILSGESGFVEACFTINEPASIKEKRTLVSQVLQLETLSPEHFWYFVNSLLSLNADAYRAVISSSLAEL